MNKPAHPVISTARVATPYDADAYAWAMEQAAFLRERRFDAIDWENVAEEIESVARTERREARSRLRVLMAHILKWEHQPNRRSRSWALTIVEQRLGYEQAMDENPSLKPFRDEIRDEAYRSAKLKAARETKLDLKTFPADPPSWETLLERPFDPPAA